MSDTARGVLAMVAACAVWGLSPLFYIHLSHVPTLEVLAHRTLWSAIIFAAVLALQGRLGQLAVLMRSGRALRIAAVASVMISTNWFLFIWSVSTGHTTEASLGYFLFPLVAVLIGRVAFGERLARLQWLAVALAGLAVAVLTWGLGVPPWIALVLASTFGVYGLVKKRLDTGPVLSVTAEVLLLAPIALAVLVSIHAGGGGQFGARLQDSLLLAVSGGLTALPLILFSYAARRVKMSTLGLLQYLNPSLQFFCAVVIFAEPFGPWHAIAFPVIWAALLLYSLSAYSGDRAARRAASRASTDVTT